MAGTRGTIVDITIKIVCVFTAIASISSIVLLKTENEMLRNVVLIIGFTGCITLSLLREFKLVDLKRGELFSMLLSLIFLFPSLYLSFCS